MAKDKDYTPKKSSTNRESYKDIAEDVGKMFNQSLADLHDMTQKLDELNEKESKVRKEGRRLNTKLDSLSKRTLNSPLDDSTSSDYSSPPYGPLTMGVGPGSDFDSHLKELMRKGDEKLNEKYGFDDSGRPYLKKKSLLIGFGILGVLLGIFFLSTNITGNVIFNLSQKSNSLIGAILFFSGIFGVYLYSKKSNLTKP